MVITKKRFLCHRNEFDCEPHYLQQTLAAFDIESKWKRSTSGETITVIVCNVDPNWEHHFDFDAIKNFFPLILRYNYTSIDRPSNKKQETSDYAFCLEEASLRLQTNYLIVAEDDAIVFENFFSTLSSIVKNRVETNMVRGEQVNNDIRWCWMKLYFPEFWSGFGWDANRLWELFWIAIAGGLIGSMLALTVQAVNKRSKVSAFWWALNGFLYLLMVALVVSRPTWLELRRIHTSLLQVTSDSGCCSTVAVLYPMHQVQQIVEYLRSPNCHRCSIGVDLAIRDYKDKTGMLGLLVQPNLARHIGYYSTVSSSYKDPIQMLFYDFLWF